MIAFVRGLLVERHPTQVVLDVSGVGYEVLIPLSTYDRLPATGQVCQLYTHHHVREDAQTLYGFAGADEKAAFELLVLVNGIGPKVAMAVLSGLTVRDLRAAIADGDIKRLSSVHGVGRKTAERMVVELRDRIDPAEALAARLPPGSADAGTAILRDAVLALTALGFSQDQARKMVQSAIDGGADASNTEALLKNALGNR
jgi:Holliday junction DNA helicase RuvA